MVLKGFLCPVLFNFFITIFFEEVKDVFPKLLMEFGLGIFTFCSGAKTFILFCCCCCCEQNFSLIIIWFCPKYWNYSWSIYWPSCRYRVIGWFLLRKCWPCCCKIVYVGIGINRIGVSREFANKGVFKFFFVDVLLWFFM